MGIKSGPGYNGTALIASVLAVLVGGIDVLFGHVVHPALVSLALALDLLNLLLVWKARRVPKISVVAGDTARSGVTRKRTGSHVGQEVEANLCKLLHDTALAVPLARRRKSNSDVNWRQVQMVSIAVVSVPHERGSDIGHNRPKLAGYLYARVVHHEDLAHPHAIDGVQEA